MSLRSATSRKTNNLVTVTAETARDPSVLGGVFEYFQGVVSSRQSQGEETRERILWARFEVTDLNDASLPQNDRSSREHKCLPLILILGYITGFSVWSIQGDGDAQELLSDHDGPVRFATILKTPYPGAYDEFAEHRPIIGVVTKKGQSRPYTQAGFKSLKDGKRVKSVKIDNDQKLLPLVNILSNRRAVVVVRSKAMILILDAGTLMPKFYIKNGYKSDKFPYNPISLGTRWLAFADSKLSSKHQSIGGMSSGLPQTYKSTVISAAKKVGAGLFTLTDKVYGWTGASEGKASSSPKPSRSGGSTFNAIVTILDLEELFKRDKSDEVCTEKLERDEGVVANFIAHTGEDCSIAALAFDPSGMLLVTACTLGHSFHVFRILPHPLLSSQTAVHHLYTLYRGDTQGTVQDIAVSNDSRWISVSTLHGTSHVFPITPYGGSITTRTHTGDKVVNQMSKFQATAGVDETVKRSTPNVSSESTPAATSLSSSPKYASSVVTMGQSVHNWGNPRSPPLPSPIQLEAMAQIKQPYVASEITENMNSTVIDELPTLQASDVICIAAIFAPTRTRTSPSDSLNVKVADSLFILGSNGVLTEHILTPQKATGVPDGDDAPIELCHKPELEWNLLRKPQWAKLSAFYAVDCPLVIAYNNLKEYRKGSPKLSQSDSEWLANIEIETHPSPHRRLWMGPQFRFKTYQAPKSSGNELILQAQQTLIHHNEDPFSQSAELSVTPMTLQQNLLLDIPDTSQLQFHSLKIPQESLEDDKEYSTDDNVPVVEIYGSYKDNKPLFQGTSEVELKQELDSAIKETTD